MGEENRDKIRDERKQRRTAAKQDATAAYVQPRKLRVLALHGGMQCAASFKSGQMKKVERAMKDMVEFVYPNAPFAARWPNEAVGAELDGKRRSWWRWNDLDPADERYAVNGYEQDGTFYHHLGDSLEQLRNLWATDGGFDGIFGFSQGAIVASIFCDWMQRMNPTALLVARGPQMRLPFVVLASAFLKPVPLNFPHYWVDPAASYGEWGTGDDLTRMLSKAAPTDIPLDVLTAPNRSGEDGGTRKYLVTRPALSAVPSLHMFGKSDTIMPNERSLALAQRYQGSIVHVHDGGHVVPSDPDSLDVLRRFVRGD